jgi:phage-related holin
MIYILIAIAGLMTIVTTAIFQSISKKQKYYRLKRALLIAISLIIFIVITYNLIQQPTF